MKIQGDGVKSMRKSEMAKQDESDNGMIGLISNHYGVVIRQLTEVARVRQLAEKRTPPRDKEIE